MRRSGTPSLIMSGRGNISRKQMKLVELLDSYVGRRHLLRMKQGRDCDAAEMREILSDWYNCDMHGMDKNTALEKLIDIFNSCDVNIPALQTLRNC